MPDHGMLYGNYNNSDASLFTTESAIVLKDSLFRNVANISHIEFVTFSSAADTFTVHVRIGQRLLLECVT